MPSPRKILFVCGRNQWRSPTAERIYRADTRVLVRSAGVGEASRHLISSADLDWADIVLVMERRHAMRIRERFSDRLTMPPIESLDIPDEYQQMDSELVELIRAGTEPFIGISNPNPSPDPTSASGTPAAEQLSRHP